jgi:hypothetical protein
MENEKYGFAIGDRIVNLNQVGPNFKKTGSVVGFHVEQPTVFVRYDDGTLGRSREGKIYKKISELLPDGIK